MSFFGRVDKSTTGAAISKVARLSVRTAKHEENKSIKPGQGRREIRRCTSVKSANLNFENWFIGALVGAGQCSAHTQPRTPFSTSRRFKQLQAPQSRGLASPAFFTARRSQYTTSCEATGPPPLGPAQLHGIVDQYGIQYNEEEFEREVYEIAPQAKLEVSDKPDDVSWPPEEYRWTAPPSTKAIINNLRQALHDRYHDPADVYHIYRQLPAPRIPYLSPKVRHGLLRHLGSVERKDETSMLRYLSVLDDAKINNIPLTVDEWNSALSFIARYMKRTTATDLEAALQLFKEMENKSGVPANSATFNILFDAATKAGKFHLAEMIYEEMTRRGFPYNRFHHVSLIWYFGLKQDGEGVRKAYKSMVDAGEVIDTVALNAVIASLIKAKEFQAAMQVYERMVKLYVESSSPPQLAAPIRDYKKKRQADRALVALGRIGREKPQLLEKHKAKSPVRPDVQTYRILINHAAIEDGSFHTVTKLLDEMSWYGLPVHGSIFVALFNGFAVHGGELYTYWTPERLENVWKSFMKSLKSDSNPDSDVYLGKWVIVWALRAFSKCCGIERTRQIWTDISQMWKGTDEEMDHVREVLQEIMDEDNKRNYKW